MRIICLLSSLSTVLAVPFFQDLNDKEQIYIASRFAAATYCKMSDVIDWTCGERCEIVSDFKVHNFVEQNGLAAFIGYSAQFRLAVLAFRGTIHVENFFTDLQMQLIQIPWMKTGVLGHKGFVESYLSLKPFIQQSIKAMEPSIYTLITGHSLGGALSILAATDMTFAHAITFGSPRIGNKLFASEAPPTIRAINQNDVFPHMPLRSQGYLHGPQEFWRIGNKLIPCSSTDGEDEKCSNSLHIYGYFAHLEYEGIYFTSSCK